MIAEKPQPFSSEDLETKYQRDRISQEYGSRIAYQCCYDSTNVGLNPAST